MLKQEVKVNYRPSPSLQIVLVRCMSDISFSVVLQLRLFAVMLQLLNALWNILQIAHALELLVFKLGLH